MHPALALGPGHAVAIGERQLDILVYGEVADQVETLEDEADLAVANARAVAEIQIRHRLAVQVVLPPVGVSSSPMMESSVDLPQPDGPDMATYSPFGR